MRGHSAVGRKFVVVCTAVLMALGLAAGTAVPSAAQPKPGPRAQVASAQGLSDEGPSVTADLFSSLAQAAGGKVGSAAAGWAMSAMGLSTGDSAALASINGDLQTISTQLAGIQAQLTQLTDAIQTLDCNALSADITNAVAEINTYETNYSSFVDQGAGINTNGDPPSVPPPSVVDPWAMSVINTSSGLLNAFYTIRDALLPAGTAQGILTACLQPGILPKPAQFSIGDFDPTWKTTLYYNTVENLVDFYYNNQAQALLLLQEAYHYLAWQAAGQTGNPQDPGSVCTDTTNATAQSYCTSAIVDTNAVYEALGAEFQTAGLPYTDNEVILMNNGGSNPPLFPRSLEAFTQAAGDTSCPTPLTSADPCGITTANGNTVGDAMNVNYDGYTKWRAATETSLVNLIKNRGSETPGVYMNQSGFQHANNKIILTGAHASFDLSDEGDLTGQMVCFLSTDTQFMCGDSDVNGYLTELYYAKHPVQCPPDEWRTSPLAPTNANGFYTLQTHDRVYDLIACAWGWTTEPGWLVGNTGPSALQYRWPDISVGTGLTCTNGRSPLNPGGVPTRCGTDFDTMFNTIVTRPVTCTGTIVGLCGDQVHISLTGPHAGEWSQVLNGNVTVALDSTGVRKISGTVLVQATNGAGTARVTFDITRAGGRHAFYTGTVKIKADGDRVLVVPLRHAQIVRHADGTVSGQVLVPRGRHGSYTLTWSVLDNPN